MVSNLQGTIQHHSSQKNLAGPLQTGMPLMAKSKSRPITRGSTGGANDKPFEASP